MSKFKVGKFKLGDVVVSIYRNEDSSQQVLKVIEIDHENETVLLEDANPDILNAWHDVDDYELVYNTDDVSAQKPIEQVQNNPSFDEATIHSELAKMMNEITQLIAVDVDGKCVELTIESEYYSGTGLDIKFKCRIGYDEMIESNNLRQSATIALRHWKEKMALKPLAIGVMRDA